MRDILLVTLLVLAAGQASADDTACIKYAYLLNNMSRGAEKTIVLTRMAAMQFSHDECTKTFRYPPKGLVETEVNKWWVLHDSNEDMHTLFSILEENTAVISNAMKNFRGTELFSWQFWGADLRSILDTAEDACSLHYKLDKDKKYQVSAFRPASDMNSICDDVAIFAAINGLSLINKDDQFIAVVPLTSGSSGPANSPLRSVFTAH